MISELLSNLDYTSWAEAALILFLAVFAAVVVRTLRTSDAEAARNARLPIDDLDLTGEPGAARTGSPEGRAHG